MTENSLTTSDSHNTAPVRGGLGIRDLSRLFADLFVQSGRRRRRRQQREALRIRRRARVALEQRCTIPAADLHRLAVLEGVYLDRPRRRARLAPGLVARVFERSGQYLFLGYDGYYYRSSHRYGHGRSRALVLDTRVPVQVRILAQPYRLLCDRAQGWEVRA